MTRKAKKKTVAPGAAQDSHSAAPTHSLQPSLPQPQLLKKYAAIVAVTFIAAFIIAWLVFRPGPQPARAVREIEQDGQEASVPGKTIDAAGLGDFLKAAETGDYPAMAEIGGKLFVKGDTIPDHKRLLSSYAVDGFPPYQVYKFYSATTDTRIYRVLLTMDDNNTVESFMAEEMPVVR